MRDLPVMGHSVILSWKAFGGASADCFKAQSMPPDLLAPFLKTLKGIFTSSRAPSNVHSSGSGRILDIDEEDIPRYPPFAKGMPVAPVDRVMATQAELVERIRMALGFKKEDFHRLVVPVIERYASFVHLLPASEAHHHRGAGGLFRHGLEVAFWSAQASEGVIFSTEGTPRERRDNEPRWRLASCFSGLLHDVGKPLSDVSITDRNGKIVWNPYGDSLYEWARKNNVDRYFIRWRDKRHKRHESFSLLTVDRILPDQTRGFLSESGPKIMEAMLEAISGTGVNQPVTKLMLMADRESVARDLKQSRLNVDEFSYGVPVERYVFDAIRRLVKQGTWKVNELGAKVWHLKQGVFIVWKPAQDITDLVEKDKIPGVPRDADTLADILVERGFAVSNIVSENGNMATYRYWEVMPDLVKAQGLEKPLLMLRLESPDLVFTTEPPPAVEGVVTGEAAAEEVALNVQLTDLNAPAVAPGSSTENDWKDMRFPPDESAQSAAASTAPAPAQIPIQTAGQTAAHTSSSAPVAQSTGANVSAQGAPAAQPPSESNSNMLALISGLIQSPSVAGVDEDGIGVSAEVLKAEQDAMSALAGIGMMGLDMFAPVPSPVPAAAAQHKPDPLPTPPNSSVAESPAPPKTEHDHVSSVEVSPMQMLAQATGSKPDVDAPATVGPANDFLAVLTANYPSATESHTPSSMPQSAGQATGKSATKIKANRADRPKPEAAKGGRPAAALGTVEQSKGSGKDGVHKAAMPPSAPPPAAVHAAARPPAVESATAPDSMPEASHVLPPPSEYNPLQELIDLNIGLGFDPLPEHMRLANDVVEPVLSEEPICTQSEPGAGPVDLSGGLADVLAQYGSQVQALIMAAVMPVLLRDMTLGEVLFMHGQQAAIYYPEGARKIGGEASEVIKILAQQHAISINPATPGRYVWDFDGYMGIVLCEPISEAIRVALAQAGEQEEAGICQLAMMAPVQFIEVTPSEPTPMDKLRGAALAEAVLNTGFKMPVRQKRTKTALRDVKPKGRGADPGLGIAEAAAPRQSPLFIPAHEKRTESQPPVALAIEHEISKVSSSPAAGAEERADSQARPKGKKDKQNAAKPDTGEVIEVRVDPIERAFQRLIEMIKAGNGPWLASAPIREGEKLLVDKRTLQLMTNDLIGVELMTVHFKMSSFGFKVRENQLIYSEK
ncbi:TraI domain-containing protein (plasmid) [Comamonas sp. C11]|nr:MobH family relaxase [Comamonas sp. C11]UUC96613.1 TraI domain-containing protein [Comamonas sp. C11]